MADSLSPSLSAYLEHSAVWEKVSKQVSPISSVPGAQ